jgi:hypothetical protein
MEEESQLDGVAWKQRAQQNQSEETWHRPGF